MYATWSAGRDRMGMAVLAEYRLGTVRSSATSTSNEERVGNARHNAYRVVSAMFPSFDCPAPATEVVS